MVAGGEGQVMREEQVQAWQDSTRTLAHGVREVAEGQVCCHDASCPKRRFLRMFGLLWFGLLLPNTQAGQIARITAPYNKLL